MTIGAYLKKLREEKGLNKKETATALGIPYTTYVNYENDSREPNAITLSLLASFFDVTIDYLLDRSEESEGFDLRPYRGLISKYRTLDEHGREAIDGLLNTEYKRMQRIAAQPDPDEDPQIIRLPIPGLPASAGCGVDIIENESEYIEVPLNNLTRRADLAIRVKGDSMAPKFCDGDILLVREQPAVDEGELGIFILDDMGYFKKLGHHELISINDNYDNVPIGPEDELRCIGKVLGKL